MIGLVKVLLVKISVVLISTIRPENETLESETKLVKALVPEVTE